MKASIITAMLMLGVLSASAADKETAKTGFNVGPLPAISYSTDLGFQYGALADIFYYGDGSKYPEYIYKFNVEASRYTKGNSVLHMQFDGKHLIPGIRISGVVSYLGNNTQSFYGFNGASSIFYKDLNRISDEGMGFYLMKRSQMRVIGNIQGKIGDSRWSWMSGLAFYHFSTGEAQNKGITSGTPSLYDLYVKNNIISPGEMNGGNHFEIKGGVIFDTRDHENNPTRGTNFEVLAVGSYDFLQHRNNYLVISTRFSQFHPLVSDKLILGYRVAIQNTVLGDKPFYMLQNIENTNVRQVMNEGLGSLNTIRGTLLNRMQGRGYTWANVELRYNFLRGDFIGQHWILAVNPFFDAGTVINPYRYDQMVAAADNPVNKTLTVPGTGHTVSELLYSGRKETLHASAGAGLHIIMNQNFNIRAEFAKTFSSNDGGFGMAIGLNYIF